MEAKVYTKEGKESGKVALPKEVFETAWNADLVHEVVVSMQSNARSGSAHTKDRSEVSGGGKKPWRQKGTGRARHGSRRSPIWSGGGVAHGPRSEKDYTKKINLKMKRKAFASVLAKKHADGELIFVEDLAMSEPKTATAKAVMVAIAKGSGHEDLATKRKNAALVVLGGRNLDTEKSFRNFGNYEIKSAKDINPVDLLTYKYVVVAEPKVSLETFTKRAGTTSEAAKKS